MPRAPGPGEAGKSYAADPPELTPTQRAELREHLNKMREEDALEWMARLRAAERYYPDAADTPEDWYGGSWLFGDGPFNSPGWNDTIDKAHDAWERHALERLNARRKAAGLPPADTLTPKSIPPPTPGPQSPQPTQPPQPNGPPGRRVPPPTFIHPASADTTVAAAMAAVVFRRMKGATSRPGGPQEF